jgi:hypothetical protein
MFVEMFVWCRSLRVGQSNRIGLFSNSSKELAVYVNLLTPRESYL